jgi:hypothetical protein
MLGYRAFFGTSKGGAEPGIYEGAIGKKSRSRAGSAAKASAVSITVLINREIIPNFMGNNPDIRLMTSARRFG